MMPNILKIFDDMTVRMVKCTHHVMTLIDYRPFTKHSGAPVHVHVGGWYSRYLKNNCRPLHFDGKTGTTQM